MKKLLLRYLGIAGSSFILITAQVRAKECEKDTKPSTTPKACKQKLGIAGEFNLFVFGNLSQPSSNTEGRVAVGGNANLSSYSIGAVLRPDTQRDDLVVAGKLVFHGGAILNGGLGTGSAPKLDQVSVYGKVHLGYKVDFAKTRSNLTWLSVNLAGRKPNGFVQIQDFGNPRSEVKFIGSQKELNVYEISGKELARAHTVIIDGTASGSKSTHVINVTGTSGQLESFGMFLMGVTRERILFNFADADSLKVGSVSVEASILAPDASLVFPSGQINGNVIVQAMQGTGQFSQAPFQGCLDDPCQGLTTVD